MTKSETPPSTASPFHTVTQPFESLFDRHLLSEHRRDSKKAWNYGDADEVYGHLTFGNTPFVPMGVFGSIVPVLTLGSISKRWIVPGWRIGWLVTSDPHGILQESGVVESIKGCLNISSDPVTFIQVKLNLSSLEGIDDDMTSVINLLKRNQSCYSQVRHLLAQSLSSVEG
ncbi:aminotransferase TAT [Salix suchowensis]|nr:aminotransferase TAT [Salix suchowensis]